MFANPHKPARELRYTPLYYGKGKAIRVLIRRAQFTSNSFASYRTLERYESKIGSDLAKVMSWRDAG